jgi:LysR family hydrogen peroxide-inducible transcriptional activator
MAIALQLHDLTLRQLQYIVAVADHLGFHKAAAACHVSQPTLSAQVQQLESALGVTLFERDRRRVLLTAAGHAVVERARRILVDVGDLLAAATRAREPFTGTLRIGVIPTIAPYLLPELTPKISAAYPKLSVVFREEKTSEVVRELDEGTLDAGIVALEADVGDCAHALIAHDDFVAALPKGHPLARKKRLTLSELEGARVLLLDEGHCLREQALALCTKVRAEETDFRATSLSTLAQMVSSGAGITLLPSLAVDVENRRSQLDIRPFAKPVPGRTIALVWRPRSPLGEEFALLAETLRRPSPATSRGNTKA